MILRHFAVCAFAFILSAVPLQAEEAAFLGVALADSSDPADQGVAVAAVLPGSPAAKHGVKHGDRILAINETGLSKARQLVDLIAGLKSGDKASLQILRESVKQTIEVVKLRLSPGGVMLGSAGEYAELDLPTASHVFVDAVDGA